MIRALTATLRVSAQAPCLALWSQSPVQMIVDWKKEDSKVSLLYSDPQIQLWKSFVWKIKAWRSASELQLYWTSPVLVQCPEQNADFDSLVREHPIKIVFAWQNKHPLRPDLVVLVGPLASSRYHDPDNNFILSNQNAFDLIIIWNDWAEIISAAEYPKPIKIHSELNSIANFRNRWLRISPHDQDNGTRILNQQLKLVTKIFGRLNSVANMDKQKAYCMSHILCGRHNETQTIFNMNDFVSIKRVIELLVIFS